MVDPKNSTICSKTRGYSSIRSSSLPNPLPESCPSFNQITFNLKKSTPSLSQEKSLSTKSSLHPSQAILNRPLLSRTKYGSTNVYSYLSQTMPNRSSNVQNRVGHTIPPSTTDLDTPLSDEVQCGSIQHQGSGTTTTSRTNDHDPEISEAILNLKKSKPSLNQEKSLSTKSSLHPSEAILNRPLLSRTKSGSTKVYSHLSQTMPNRSSNVRNRAGHTIPPNTTDLDTPLSNEVQCGSIQHQRSGTTTTSRTNDHDPEISEVVISRSAVRRHKSRRTISLSMANVSTLEKDLEDPENDDPDAVVETDGVGDSAYLLSQGNNRKRRRGVCNSSTISQMLRTNKEPLKVRLDVGHGRPVGEKTSSLLSHVIGEQVRQFLPVHVGYWKEVDDSKKDESIRSLMTYFDFELDEEGRLETGISEYLDLEFAKLFREFKSELHVYYQQYSHDDAKRNPPLQWEKRKNKDWITMCDHFLSERFQKQSKANKENRDKKKYNHHGGSKPIALRYEEHVQKGSQFPNIDAFKETYTDKDGNWTSDVVKNQYEEMESQANALLKELAAGYPEGTPSEEIIVPKDVDLKILIKVLGIKPGREIRGLGFGRYRDLGSSATRQGVATSLRFKEMKQELAKERAARKNMERYVHTLVKALSTQVPGLSLSQEFSAPFADEDDDDIVSP